MVLNLFVLLIVLGITFMHSLFGLFSGLINLVCAVAALAVTFGFFESLNALIAEQGLHPSYTLPVTFILLFFITHMGLRLAADNLIRGNVRVPMYVDWAGAGVCGFFIAMITTGVLVLGFLMLPWGGRVMMYQRQERTDEIDPQTRRAEFTTNHVGWFLRPDEFAAGLFSMLSRGSLAGKTSFASVYPGFAEWVWNTGNTVQSESATSPTRGDKGDGFGERGLNVVSWWKHKGPLDVRYRPKLPTRRDVNLTEFDTRSYQPEPGRLLLGTRLRLLGPAADRDKTSSYHRFRPSMLRIVGDLDGQPRAYYAEILGGAEAEQTEPRLVDPDNNFAVPADGDPEIDVLFDVDEGFKPHFVEYRRFARAALTAENEQASASEPLAGPARSGAGESDAGSASGIMRFVDAVVRDGTGDTAELPFRMNRTALSQAGEVELDGAKLKRAMGVSAPRARLAGIGPGSVNEFALPEGHRLFQLRCKAREAASLAGQVFNFVGSVVNQYYAVGDTEYPLCGYYAIVKRDGEDFLELCITGQPNDPGFRQMLDFKSVTNQELRAADSVIGLLFYVKPGDTIKKVRSQGGTVTLPGGGYKIGSGG